MAAEVLPSARWQYCGAPDGSQRAVLVQFSNGKLQSPGNMRFTLYENKDSTNPRKRNQRILAAETDRLSYVGNNFGTGALKCNTLCRHFVGILNKTSGQMEVYDAELFNMQPLFSDVSVESELALDSQTKTYREKMDSCIEAFGTTKQKRALNARRMNRVGNESLNQAVAKAAETIIDTKGVTALVSDAIHNDLQDDSLYLPPCYDDATKPEDVYKFEDLLSPAEYEALQSPSEAFRNVTSEEILKMIEENSHCTFVIEALKSLPSDVESRDRQARCIWFLDTLIKFRAQRVVKRKSALGPGVPHIINTKTYREKMDSCIEAFGTTKQKRALNARRMNRVGNESLNQAVAKAAETIIDTKGVTALVSDAIHNDLQDDSLYLPPCYDDATKPEDVYKFEDYLDAYFPDTAFWLHHSHWLVLFISIFMF
uniref:Macaca fascicularis brain cDNA clone: QtrA-17649, similar to human RNA polymerase I associated factor 53 (PAF53), mRNA, RefSeq: NM_022490.1 n=1 Tax=Macaca fascicularis TaxID=9541 RepID=I7GEW8_MACFA|nr:unnamed protein product [Macaca fascicularis]